MKLCHSFNSLVGLTFQVFLLTGTFSFVNSYPTDHYVDPSYNQTSIWGQDAAHENSLVLHNRATGTPLRVMALGASIVYGVGSSDGNGFRGLLRQQLRSEGHEVDMVGTKKGGIMKDNDCEATSGYTVDQIHEASRLSYRFKPNLVVINAGTNDIVGNVDPNNQHIRFRNMIQALWDNISPGTVVIVSTILPLGPADQEAKRKMVNDNYRSVVRDFYANGRPIFLAEMDGHVSLSDLPDGVHPHDHGFQKMAGSFWAAIKRAKDQGRLVEPLGDADLDTEVPNCKKQPGGGVNAGALTQVGSGNDDGEYAHDSVAKGVVMTITSDWDRDQWFFARLFRSDRDDLLGWVENAAGNVVYAVRRNDGGGKFTLLGTDLDVKDNCIPRGVIFIDLNGDGLDDFACVGPDGAIYASINQGNGGNGKPPTFNHVGVWKAANPRYPQSQVRLADVDGDGRADFCGLEPNGDVYMWRNGGIGDKPSYFQALGKRFTGKGMGNLAGTRFEDINGDGRDDWIWVGDKGETHTWTNSRSCAWGVEGDGLNIAWRVGTNKATGKAPTHNGGMGTGIRNRIHFARVFGEPQAFGLLGRQDYVYMDHTKLSSGKHEFKVTVWQNNGYGSTKLKADGNRYCDMTGNGRDDYVWIWSGGDMDLFENAGRNFINGDQSYWKQPPSPGIFKPGRLLDRRDLHLVDFDGDGKCDILWTDPSNQNRVQMWRNRYTPGGGFNWEFIANPAPTLYCPEKRGLGIFDLPVRFADITGSGRADYLCIEKDGRVWGWTQDGLGGWSYMDQIKSSKTHDRANLRFADVNGDGRADAIWVEKFTGDSFVYYNLGRRDIGGSRFHWETLPQGGPARAYSGSYSGSCQYFPDFDGNGRADLHSIEGTFTNKAHTAYNLCGTNSIGDDQPASVKPPIIMPPDGPPGEGTPGSGNGGGGGGGGGGAQPIEDGWRKVQCTDDGITDASKDGEYRWNKIMTGSAWAAAVQHWKTTHRDKGSFTFVRSISDFFNGPENMACESLTETNGCHGGNNLQCHDTNAPAGYFILNSFRQLNGLTYNLFTALSESQASISAKIGTLTETFSPVKKEDISFNVMIDIITLGYGTFMAPTWNKWLKNVPWSRNNPNNFDTLKDWTNDMVLGGFTLTKDLVDEEPGLGSQNALSTNVETVVKLWKEGLEAYTKDIFSGDDDNLYKLRRIIENGKLMDPYVDTPTLLELSASLDKVLYGLLIPTAWSISQDDINPFILDSKKSCSDADKGEDVRIRVTSGARSTKVCVNNRAFYLVAARNPAQNCWDSRTKGQGCDPFDLPPGAKAMGKAWGDVTIEDIVVGSLNTFKKHGGNQVNPQLPGELRDDQVLNMADQEIRAPYFFNLPVCDIQTSVWAYFYGMKNNPSNRKLHFPCDAKYDEL